jgi:single-strand DNA-binding protein
MNRIVLVGNLGSDPKFFSEPGKIPVCTFSIATNERGKSKSGESVKITEWHNVVTFGRTAAACSKSLRKGDKTYVEGALRTDTWLTKEGEKNTSKKVIARQVTFLHTKPLAQGTEEVTQFDTTDEEIPF